MEGKHQFNKGYLKQNVPPRLVRLAPVFGLQCASVVCRSPALRASEHYSSEVLVQRQ